MTGAAPQAAPQPSRAPLPAQSVSPVDNMSPVAPTTSPQPSQALPVAQSALQPQMMPPAFSAAPTAQLEETYVGEGKSAQTLYSPQPSLEEAMEQELKSVASGKLELRGDTLTDNEVSIKLH